MKKLLLIPALLLGSVVMATDYNYEITPLIGYNIAEGNIDLDDYAVFGAEIQYNGLDSIFKPELSIFYSEADYNTGNADTNVWRIALNGVYEYDKLGNIIPLAKLGLGYENMSDPYSAQTGNHNSPFVDAGIGAKIPFSDAIALKLEAIYMLKYSDARYDNNLMITAGLNIAFGSKAQEAAPVAVEPVAVEPVVVVPVDGDDDNDGVLNSIDKCPTTAAGKTVNAEGCFIDGDDDKDGVLNSIDKCPTTAAGKTVNAEGCFIDGDDDKDGVLNSVDKCPTTATGEAVDVDGCPASVNLNVNFENNSFNVDAASDANIQEFADFLIMYPTYSAKIVGYTDSRGSAHYNQKLSENRANAVKNMIIEKGVPANKISSVGMGEVSPVADNATSEGRAQNRRIEAELTRD
jgi:OOP family OmpA-OmpF porin